MPARTFVSGCGAVSPLGIGAARYFDRLMAGESGVREISHFPADGLDVRIAAFCRDFNPASAMREHDLKHLSRAVPMAVAASAEALHEARLDPDALTLHERRRFAVVLGSGGGAMDFLEHQYALWHAGQTRKGSVYVVPSGTAGNLASELSMRFGLHGPSLVVTTGCTSSSDALGAALLLLRSGRADRVLAGGVDCTVTRGMMEGLCLMRILAKRFQAEPARACRPFDRDRDGFVLGEGAWMMVLEREPKRPLAELAGYAATCDAHHRVRMAEDGIEPARAMTEACTDAGVRPDEVGAVWCHGTGTRLNDEVEARALGIALGPRCAAVPATAIKSMIAHPQGACGAAAAVAAVHGLRAGALPPTLNLDHPECPVGVSPGPRDVPARVAMISTLGFGSRNSVLVVRST
jgi:3-oxoacyl-[acyl-carrier-protein] synthase II